MAAQEPPDILDVNIAHRLGQQRSGPACKSFWRRLVQQLQNPLVGCLRVDRLLARPRLVFQSLKTKLGIATPPKTDNPRLDPNLLGDRPGAAPGRRQQNYPRPLQIALQCHRRATTSRQNLAIFPRKVDFSCFGYHPNLKSRLTLQEKRVLGLIDGRAIIFFCAAGAARWNGFPNWICGEPQHVHKCVMANFRVSKALSFRLRAFDKK